MVRLLKSLLFFLFLSSQFLNGAAQTLDQEDFESEDDDVEGFVSIKQKLNDKAFGQIRGEIKSNNLKAVKKILHNINFEYSNPLSLALINEALQLETPDIARFLIESLTKPKKCDVDPSANPTDLLASATYRNDLPGILEALACGAQLPHKLTNLALDLTDVPDTHISLPAWSLRHTECGVLQKILIIKASSCHVLEEMDAQYSLIKACRKDDQKTRILLLQLGCKEIPEEVPVEDDSHVQPTDDSHVPHVQPADDSHVQPTDYSHIQIALGVAGISYRPSFRLGLPSSSVPPFSSFLDQIKKSRGSQSTQVDSSTSPLSLD